MEFKTEQYANTLSRMIRHETVSSYTEPSREKFQEFRVLLRTLFPSVFSHCEMTEFDNGFVLKWSGKNPGRSPVLFMNHHDVVEANGEWEHDAFSGAITEDRIWGRGTLDDKGGLWAMLQAADELVQEGFRPERDIWFSSTCTEETTGAGADEISRWFEEQKIRFEMSFDEGGMILYEPISGAKGTFAMIGIGEKGCADLKFIARSNGGHASMPEKNSPLVRLGKFMAEADRNRIFPNEMSPAVCEMFRRFAPYMGGAGKLLSNPEKHRAVLAKVIPVISNKASALLRTTLAFTMAQGSGAPNVIPSEAWVGGNMRYSHHQGQQGSFDAVRKLAAKYDVEMEVEDPGVPSRLADYNGHAFKLVEKALGAVFPEVIPVPYIMTGASDSRFFDRVCDQCIRFLPFQISDQQLDSIHGRNENLDLKTLVPAVQFYRTLMKEV
ncbi:MAG: M20/M25/M40 family metallo-hydrolase [Oscillospiraceae bacterium]|nr:M20/M25/M40 family metallo-hydrolase [Oscillospiraceae bacterium]